MIAFALTVLAIWIIWHACVAGLALFAGFVDRRDMRRARRWWNSLSAIEQTRWENGQGPADEKLIFHAWFCSRPQHPL